jgi:hypothetical protein
MQGRRFATPSLCFLATQDRLAPPPLQRRMAARFASIRVLETETWHLHCAEVLGPRYGEAMREATAAWLK